MSQEMERAESFTIRYDHDPHLEGYFKVKSNFFNRNFMAMLSVRIIQY